MMVGNEYTLRAEGTPPGGKYFWTVIPQDACAFTSPNGTMLPTISLKAEKIAQATVIVTYTHHGESADADKEVTIVASDFTCKIFGKELGQDDLPIEGAEWSRLIENIHPVDSVLLRDLYVAEGLPAADILRQELDSQVFVLELRDFPSNKDAEFIELKSDFESTGAEAVKVVRKAQGVYVSEKPVILYYGELPDEILQFYAADNTVLDADAALDNLTTNFCACAKSKEKTTNVFRVAVLRVDGTEVLGPVPTAEQKEVLALVSRMQLGITWSTATVWATVGTESGAVYQEVEVPSWDNWERLSQETFRLRIYGDVETSSVVTIPVLVEGDIYPVNVRFERSAPRQMTSQLILKVREGIPPEGCAYLLAQRDVAAFGGGDERRIKLQKEKYFEFKSRKTADSFDLFMYGHQSAELKDRMQAILSSYDSNAVEANTVENPVVDRTNVGAGSYVPISDVEFSYQQSELLNEALVQGRLDYWKIEDLGWNEQKGFDEELLYRWGPWDPHLEEVLPLTIENLPKINDRFVSIHAHGSVRPELDLGGTYQEWDQMKEDFRFDSSAPFAKVVKDNGKLQTPPSITADNLFETPLRPKGILFGSCNAWVTIVEGDNGLIKKNSRQPDQKKKWTSPIAACYKAVQYGLRPVLHFVTGVEDATKLRITSEFSALWNGFFVSLYVPQDFDMENFPSQLPQEFAIDEFGPDKERTNNRPEKRLANPKLQRIAGQARMFSVSWQDIYLANETNKAVLEFTPVFYTFTDKNSDTFHLIKVILHEDHAHGIYESFTFWMAARQSNRHVFSAVVLVEELPGGSKYGLVPANVAPALYSFSSFGKNWWQVFKHYYDEGKLTHAYWDYYMMNDYNGWSSLREYQQILLLEEISPGPKAKFEAGLFFAKESFRAGK